MKAIFLDIDGVLNNCFTTELTPAKYIGIDDYLVERLRCIVDATQAQIILVSSWKVEQMAATKEWLYLLQKLRNYGLYITDTTQEYENWGTYHRLKGILNYLYKHPQYTSWIALDDQYFDYYENPEGIDHVIMTDYSTGITERIVNAAINTLNKND